ncbi:MULTISPECIES: aromatic-ring-hydroxylating dioxygenase subunit beta [unclassified Sphingomonas]|uniref:aromatic-ring-hydroxylating dioxygenase subunit beta n=1 Tax=unclassified Sphingomonas TaxID=196159 RepID=UPI000701BDC1|nr:MULTISPECIES: aromatic-ring-hydroxylating dioxygenase subunit beta [unclassified Sphingomonas]KQX18675.1 aromatic-ring-hydroxylating dioxygenase [Sphingomonas sp. Root1294]KQY72002.1 aromatic-ring-hydroxylating dioxygenase [Sphingomonas sp. Root50]KRB94731.1 aromatic-ring-hydroxylating dioxygenase [Sphingomonas sp. Root720]
MSTLAETRTETPASAAPSLQDAIQFIWAEADMLDRLDYRAWLPLWTEGGRYVIPTERDIADYDDRLNIVNDDAEMRQARVKRLLSGFSMSSAPPARTVRTVSRFVPVAVEDGAITLRAAMILVEYKYERMRTLAADVDYRIVATGDGLRLDRKIVTLVNCDDYQHGIGYLL